MDKYKTIQYDYRSRTKRYIVMFPKTDELIILSKKILGRTSTKHLFIKTTPYSFEIYEFFIFELANMLEKTKEQYPDLAVKIGGLLLNDLIGFCKTKTWLSNRFMRDYNYTLNTSKIKQHMRFEPLDNQVPAFEKYNVIKEMSNIKGGMLDAAAGTGKALSNSTKVLTPDGWVKICDIKTDDYVIGSNGDKTKVTGVYPQGVRKLVELRFEDNRSISCDLDHLWTINGKTCITKDILKRLDNNEVLNIPLYDPIYDSIINSKQLPIHPYLIGVLIATTYNNEYILPNTGVVYDTIKGIMEYNNISNTSMTDYIDNLMSDTRLRDVTDIICDSVSVSNDDKRTIIKALLDTVGTSNDDVLGMAISSKDVAVGIRSILWGLGCISTISKQKSYYIVSMRDYDHIQKIHTTKSRYLKILGYIPVKDDEATCIAVDAEDKQFIIEKYIVTHNTYISLSLAETLEYDHTIIIAPKATIDEVWVKSVTDQLYKIPQTNVVLNSSTEFNSEKFIIFHYEYIDKILKNKKLLRKLKRLKPLVIVDEFHNFNEITSQRTNNLVELLTKLNIEDSILLTGTPIKMRLEELVPMLYVLDSKFKPVVGRFKEFYNGLKGNVDKVDLLRERFGLYKERIEKDSKHMPEIEILDYKVKIPDGNKYTMDNIRDKIDRYKTSRMVEILDDKDIYDGTYNRLLTDVTLELYKNMSKGEVNSIISKYKRDVKIIRKHADKRALYKVVKLMQHVKSIEREYILPKLIGNSKREFRDVISIIKYPELKVLGEALGKVLLGTRINCYTDLAKYIDYKDLLSITNKKGIIFSNYVSVCEEAIKRCDGMGYRPTGVYGEHTKDLTNIVRDFNDLESDTNPIVATFQSLSTGVPLTSGNVIIMINTPTRQYMFEQSVARAYRLGNDQKVVVYIVKLDTGYDINITERDLYILNMSTYNVELITGTKPEYDIPIQEHANDDEEEVETAIEVEIEEEVEHSMTTMFSSDISSKLGISLPEDITSYVKTLMKKISIQQ